MLSEVTGELRKETALWNRYAPCCFRLVEICEYESSGDVRSNAVFSERDCDKFTPYYHGMSPKEHLQMEMSEKQHKEVMSHGSKISMISAAVGFLAAILAAAIGLLAPFISKALDKILE